jgi:neutral ceramidase
VHFTSAFRRSPLERQGFFLNGPDGIRIVKLHMKTFRLLCLSLLFAFVSLGAPSENSAPLQVGVAETDITPPVGYRMAGYFDERFSTGVHDPLKAKAIVLQQGNEKIALVFCDLVQVTFPISAVARDRAAQLCDIPRQNICIFATHSHTGPLFDDVRGTFFHDTAVAQHGKDEHQTIEYCPFCADQIVKAIQQAQAKLAPTQLRVGIAQQRGLPFNRRSIMKNGKIGWNVGFNNPNFVRPAGPVDHDVGIVEVMHGDKAVGGLTVFAMHADTTGGTEFSADYPYTIEQTLRKAIGADYISAFGAGTCGNLNQINVHTNEDFKSVTAAARYGKMVGQTVVGALPNLETVSNPSIAARSKTIIADLQTPAPDQIAKGRALLPDLGTEKVDFYTKVRLVKAVDLQRKGNQLPMEVQAFRLSDDTAIVSLPAEIFVEFGLDIKKHSPFKNTMVISLANDRPCYIPTIEGFKQGSYEAENSRVVPGTGERLADVAKELLRDLKK